MTDEAKYTLPVMRQDLVFIPPAGEADRLSDWLIHDPVQHRFFRISKDCERIVSLWHPGKTYEDLMLDFRSRFGVDLSPNRLQQFVQFLQRANLCELTPEGAWSELKRRGDFSQSRFVRLFGSLISLRLPLFNPEVMLRVIKPTSDIAFTRAFTSTIVIVTAFGLYLSAFDMFATVSALGQSFELLSIVQIGIALVVLKACHELGHAVVAHRFGCRVPTLGVALMVLIPLLYTDVSEAWRLTSKRQRILISAAGMIVEIYLAGLATFLWAFLDEGSLRDTLFYIATVGWISSLAFNLNPLAKFDGYYILSDALEIPNLQSKATQLALWKLRKTFVTEGLVAPYAYSSSTTSALILFGLASWVYKLSLLLGIAYILYGFVAKIVGLILLVLTIGLLILLPIWRELKVWRKLIGGNGSRMPLRRLTTLTLVGLAVLFLPFGSTISAPAVLLSGNVQILYPPREAKIAGIHFGPSSEVKKGDELIDFETPELVTELAIAEIELRNLRARLGTAVSSRDGRSNLMVLQGQVRSVQQRIEELTAEMQKLQLISRDDGQVVEMSRDLRVGSWISQERRLAVITSGDELVARGYLNEQDLGEITVGSVGKFVPDDPLRDTANVVVARIAPDATRKLELPELASAFGGSIHTTSDSLVPDRNVFSIEVRLTDHVEIPNQSVRGVLSLEGRSGSLAARLWRRVTKVLVREASL
ncbi:site-2 protease family protein [Rhizobium sp. SL86]|uniref:site-2 protease family protein n=1 Tax=Rhizobium sp. SL86 TaxID=2995148 RepID=UPI002274A56C|nr:site-2 protease family protein [Rhizobium sp. SL86]MCY1667729.1 HlyD family efflux transporter periplasmic adaptor subunit [Rhizobium sp. SL86]